uniref:Single-stranded DNA-binding protein n=1 Tax=Magnetococcus massalia (strain MO-1) TaxID=451514 RepID=A0A1S7LHN3_MAGMO|nr:protein of unknown function [include Primosome PriB/single-strand DNA-binding domain] [Candidatus Magnetococcus massalia]
MALQGVNACEIIGHVGHVQGRQESPNGTALLRFSVAVNIGGKEQQRTDWFNCTAFGKAAEALADTMRKGCLVRCTGPVSARPHVGHGNKGATAALDLSAFQVNVLGWPKERLQPE